MTNPALRVPGRGDHYAANSAHHRSDDARFLRWHAPGENDVVVDLGCGSGEFTDTLAGLIPHGSVTGIDADPSMLSVARRSWVRPNLSFARGDATDVDRIVPPGSVDTVVSPAMLHWIPAERHGLPAHRRPRCRRGRHRRRARMPAPPQVAGR